MNILIARRNGKYKADAWRKRCLDHPPMYYDEAETYHEDHQIIASPLYNNGGL